jgi:antitoxin FitA
MPDVLIRDLDRAVLDQLKASALANGRSLQAEIHEVLRNAAKMRTAWTRQLSGTWHRRLAGKRFSDSTKLIREDRDER